MEEVNFAREDLIGHTVTVVWQDGRIEEGKIIRINGRAEKEVAIEVRNGDYWVFTSSGKYWTSTEHNKITHIVYGSPKEVISITPKPLPEPPHWFTGKPVWGATTAESTVLVIGYHKNNKYKYHCRFGGVTTSRYASYEDFREIRPLSEEEVKRRGLCEL